MYKLALLVCTIFLCAAAYSQNNNVTGVVKDKSEDKAVKNAVVALLTVKDSVLYKFTRTSADGSFTINNVQPGNYILMTTHPYFADLMDNIVVKDAPLKLGAVGLLNKSKILQEVIVKSGGAIKIKGDTTVYTADSFKVSANANVEELLKKLPGIQVDKNGEIKAMGEKVDKVLVDGEEFFGDDPGMAVKNLRADAVKEVQVFDKKSDQAEFTGIDDGKSQKTINLKLKEDKKKGYFGKIDAAGGTLKNIDDRYNTNLMFNAFKGKRKLAAFLLNGNTGQDGLSWRDRDKFGGEDENVSMSMDEDGGMMYMWRGGSADDEPYVSTDDGFIVNTNAGVHYNNKWGENNKHSIGLSPKFNEQRYSNIQSGFTQTQIGDSLLNENAVTNVNVNRRNFKNNLAYDIKLDSATSLKFTTKANFYSTESTEQRISNTTGNNNNLKNNSNRTTQTDNEKQAFAIGILLKHKFKKQRRTISLSTDWNLLNTDGNSFLKAINQDFIFGQAQNFNQFKETDKTTNKIAAKVTYTEPLGKKYSLELSHELSYNNGNNNQVTYTYTPATGKYDVVVDSLSNNFKQTIVINTPGFKVSYSHKKIKFNLGSGFGLTNFNFSDRTFNKDYVRNFTNFFPQAGITYSYKSNHSLRLTYNGSTTQPTLNQLQPLRDNNNFFDQYIGNPNLKPSFRNTISMQHNGYNFIKDIWTYQSLNVNVTSNAITNNRVVNPASGRTTTQPVNTDGNINISFWSGMGFKIKKADIRTGINPNFNYSRFADIINNAKSFSKTLSAGVDVYLSKGKDKKYDVSLSNNFNFNRNTTTQNSLVNKFYTNTLSTDVSIYYKKVWQLQTDYSYNVRQRTAQFSGNVNNQLWNARLKRTFKKDEFTAYILVRDILNQNIGIDRNFFANTVTETRNQRLQRYFMLGFTWDFKNKAAKAK